MDTITTKELNLFYGDFHALKDVTATIAPRRITSLIGPSGCGKSTLLRVFNRMNDLIPGVRTTGEVTVFGRPLFTEDVYALRKTVGMVFQRPNPFPLSVYDNIAHGPRVHGTTDRTALDEIVRQSLASVGLWDALKDL